MQAIKAIKAIKITKGDIKWFLSIIGSGFIFLCKLLYILPIIVLIFLFKLINCRNDLQPTYLISILARFKHKDVLYYLGTVYGRANTDLLDYNMAFLCFNTSAELGNYESTLALARMYYYGHGVEQDYNQAAYYYEKAGNGRKVLLSYKKLGDKYAFGRPNYNRDYKQAISYYLLGNEPKLAVTTMHLLLKSPIVDENDKFIVLMDHKFAKIISGNKYLRRHKNQRIEQIKAFLAELNLPPDMTNLIFTYFTSYSLD